MLNDFLSLSFDWIALHIFIVSLVFLGLTGLFMWLWNTTMMDLFNLPKLAFAQAFKLMLMSAIVFGSAGNLFSYSMTNTQTTTVNEPAETGTMTRTETQTNTTTVGLP
jgi:hypothetical protein